MRRKHPPTRLLPLFLLLHLLLPSQAYPSLSQHQAPTTHQITRQVSQRTGSERRKILLKGGVAYVTIRSSFVLEAPPLLPVTSKIILRFGKDIITSYEIQNTEHHGPNHTHIVVTSAINFHSLPGKAIVDVSIKPAPNAEWLTFEHTFEVIGLVLYDAPGPSGRRKILTGRSATPLRFTKTENGALTATVNAVVYAGEKSVEESDLRKGDITMSVTPHGILPWNATECRVAAEPDSLDERCSMAFSLDFLTFTVRVPDADKFSVLEAVVAFDWPGLREYFPVENVDGNSSPPTEELESDRVTDARVRRVGGGEEGGGKGLATWKIAVICVTCVLVVNAGLTLVFCAMRGRQVESDTFEGKVVKGGFGELEEERVKGGPWGFLIKLKPESGESSCFVEEPSSAGAGSTLLMLEGKGGIGEMGGKLVLEGVERGVDLGPNSGGGSLGLYEIEDRNRDQDRDMDGELWLSGGGVKHVVHGVGAAINRIRQVDLLRGPHSRGLVGRNGEPLREGIALEEDDDGGTSMLAPTTPFSISTVS